MKRTSLVILLFGLLFFEAQAQTIPNPDLGNWWSSPGIIGTALLIALVSFVAILIIGSRLSTLIQHLQKQIRIPKKGSHEIRFGELGRRGLRLDFGKTKGIQKLPSFR